MSTYDFECNSCGKKSTITCPMRDYLSEKITECDECGSAVSRSYSTVGTTGTDGKRNMTSPNFWKNGKSNSEIADVISGDTEPY